MDYRDMDYNPAQKVPWDDEHFQSQAAQFDITKRTVNPVRQLADRAEVGIRDLVSWKFLLALNPTPQDVELADAQMEPVGIRSVHELITLLGEDTSALNDFEDDREREVDRLADRGYTLYQVFLKIYLFWLRAVQTLYAWIKDAEKEKAERMATRARVAEQKRS